MTLWRLRATVDDRPGFLALLAASLALKSVNILAVQVHTTELGAVDDFLVDAPETVDEDDLIAAVHKGRGRDAWVARADAHGLVDTPAQVAGLAARLVQEPDALGAVLSAALGGCVIRYEAGQPLLSPTAMRVGGLVVTRLAPAFTPAEFARAQALAEIARLVQLRPAVVLLPGGTELSVRRAEVSDVDDVLAMHERCSDRSLFRRYLTGSGGPGRTGLGRLVERGVTLLAGEDDRIVAMANLVDGEAALLVEDVWQRRGIGTALLRRLLSYADGRVVLHTQADNEPMLRTIRKFGTPVIERDGNLLTVTLCVAQRVR